MQPAPDAISEFKVVTNNMSAEYGRAAGATINVAYRSGGNQFHGNAWEFLRDTRMNAVGFFKPATGKPTLSRNQYGATFGGPIVRNKAILLRRFRRLPAGSRSHVHLEYPDAGAAAGRPERRCARSAHGRRVSGGHAYPDDGVCGESAVAAARHDVRRQHEQLHDPSAVHESHRQSRRQGRHAAERSRDDLRPLRLARSQYGRSSADSAAGRRRRQRHDLREEQAARARQPPTSPATRRCSRRASDGPRRGPERIRRRSDRPVRSTSTASAGLPAIRALPADCPRRTSPAITALGRQSTNPQWQYPTVFNPKVNYTMLMGRQSIKAGYEFQRINTEVQDVNPLYGLDVYASSFTRPAPRRQATSTTSPTSCSVSARSTRSATCSSRICGRTCTSCISRTMCG